MSQNKAVMSHHDSHNNCEHEHQQHHHQQQQPFVSLNVNAKPFTLNSENSPNTTTTTKNVVNNEQQPRRKKHHPKKPHHNNNINEQEHHHYEPSINCCNNDENVHENVPSTNCLIEHSQKPFKKKKPSSRKSNHQQQQQTNSNSNNTEQEEGGHTAPLESTSILDNSGKHKPTRQSSKMMRNNKQAFKKINNNEELNTTNTTNTSTNNNTNSNNTTNNNTNNTASNNNIIDNNSSSMNSSSTSSHNNNNNNNNNRKQQQPQPPRINHRKPKSTSEQQQHHQSNNTNSITTTINNEGSNIVKRRQKFQNHPTAGITKSFGKPTMDDNSLSDTRSDVSNNTTSTTSSSTKKKKNKKNKKETVPNKKESKKKSNDDEDMFWSHSYSNIGGAFSTKSKQTVYDKLKTAKLTEKEIEELPLQEKIIYQLTRQSYDCMVCSENIKRQHHTWSCTDCHRVFHLNCIKKWVSEKVENEERSHWKCPACQFSRIVNIPTDYLCFCGKIVNPKVDLEVIPHSCGGLCGKIRSNCPHPCTDLCHPGPCAECNLTRDVKCYCEKETFYSIKCNDPNYKNGASCGRVCGKLLSCRKHSCPNPCHQGPCEPCKELINVECYCGRQSNLQQVSCSLYSHMNTSIAHREYNLFDVNNQSSLTIYRTFSCNETCKKLLPCGQHLCDRVCHYGKCISHKISQWIKTTSQEEDEGIDEFIKKNGCYQQCRSILKCGHFCTLKCHPNQIKCMKCNAQVDVYCKCGRKFEKKTCDGKSRDESNMIDFLDCDEECRKIQRVKQLAEAFQIDYEKFELPEYSNDLTDFARKYLHIVKNWEFEFDVLLTSDNKRASKQFASMKRERRALLHELAEHYKFTSISVDAEPNRSVIVTLVTQSRRPSILLSQVVTDPERLKKLKEKIIEQEEKERREEMKKYRKINSSNQSTSPTSEEEWTYVKSKSYQEEEEKEDVLSRILHSGNNTKNIKSQDVDKKLFTNSFGSFHHDNQDEEKLQTNEKKVSDTLNWGNEMEDEYSKVIEESL